MMILLFTNYLGNIVDGGTEKAKEMWMKKLSFK